MVDINKGKVKEILKKFTDDSKERFKQSQNNSSELTLLSRLIKVLYEDKELQPMKYAEKLNDEYGYSLDGYAVINIFRRKHLSIPAERIETIKWAENLADLASKAITGDKKAYEEFQIERKKTIIKKIVGRQNPQNYIAANIIFLKYPELDLYGSSEILHNLDILMGKYYFYDFVDAIGEAYGFETFKSNKKNNDINIKLSLEQAKRKVMQLENRLDMTNAMLNDLQDDFDEQLSAVKVFELTNFFASLNSEKYGYILDELLILIKGVDELRAKNFEVPLELGGILIFVKKLVQFVRDCHINPMMKINDVIKVKVSDIEYCNYDGSPFIDNEDEKTVKVVSPGWIYKDKELQISRPKLKEVDGNE